MQISLNSVHRRLARKKKLPYNYSNKDWEETVEYFGNKCAYCGCSSEKLEREHFVPLSKGGEYTKDNIIPSCMSCNRSKSDKNFFEWYKEHEHYSETRKNKILRFLEYSKNRTQQLKLL